MLDKVLLASAMALVCAASAGAQAPTGPPAPRALAADVPADAPFEPHRIAGNLYYVGTKGLCVYLITTPAGHILVNGVYPASVPQVLANVKKLKFKPTDIKLMIQSHAHPDHTSGNAALKAATGAQVLVMDDDVDVIKSGGRSDFQYSRQELFDPGPVDRILHDGEHVTLGEMDLTALKTPGHTKGCTTWTFAVKDKTKSYNVVIACSWNFNPGYKLVDNAQWPGIAGGFAHTYKVARSLKPDIWLAPHTFMFGIDSKYAKLKAGDKEAYVDPAGYAAFVETNQKNFIAEFTKQMTP